MNDDPPPPTAVPSPPTRRVGLTLAKLFGAMVGLALLLALLLPATRRAGPQARRMECKSQLHQIGIALYIYHRTWGAFPPAYTIDAQGRRLHSWRTLILPYLDQEALYQSIDLSKPWDDPANAEAHGTLVSTYHCPELEDPLTATTYQAIVGADCFFQPTQPRQLTDVTDGTAATLMVIEVDPAHAVHWMSPHDADEAVVLNLNRESRLSHKEGVCAVFADGSVRFLDAEVPAAQRRAWMTISAHDPIDLRW